MGKQVKRPTGYKLALLFVSHAKRSEKQTPFAYLCSKAHNFMTYDLKFGKVKGIGCAEVVKILQVSVTWLGI